MQSTLRPLSTLPEPAPEALAASRALAREIEGAIVAAGGAIDFSRYMELALYAPSLGYYTGGARKFGADGDFTTAPELTPLFGQTLARTLGPVLREPGSELVELGAGTGRLAGDLLDALQELDALPAHYSILELSGELRVRQHEAIAARHPGLMARVRWLDALPPSVHGAIVANEVLDVVPVHLVHWTPDGPKERCVTVRRQAPARRPPSRRPPHGVRHSHGRPGRSQTRPWRRRSNGCRCHARPTGTCPKWRRPQPPWPPRWSSGFSAASRCSATTVSAAASTTIRSGGKAR